MISIIDVSESFVAVASPAAVWLILASPPRWPEVLTDLAEAHIAPPHRLNADAFIYVKALPGSAASDMIYINRELEAKTPASSGARRHCFHLSRIDRIRDHRDEQRQRRASPSAAGRTPSACERESA